MFLLLWWEMRVIINEADISAAEHNIATKRAKSRPNYFATIIIHHNVHFHFPLAARIKDFSFAFKMLRSDSGNFGTLCGLKLTPATPKTKWPDPLYFCCSIHCCIGCFRWERDVKILCVNNFLFFKTIVLFCQNNFCQWLFCLCQNNFLFCQNSFWQLLFSFCQNIASKHPMSDDS